jgi:outer membrane lipoprotein-sorting protein
MRGPKTRITIATIALVAASSFGSAQTNPDPMAILKAVADTYTNLRSYHFVSTTEVMLADRSTRVMGEVLAGTETGETRYEISTPSLKVVAVSDGKTSWTYFPERHEYVETTVEDAPLPTVAELLSNYKSIHKIGRKVTWLRTEALPLDGGSVECDVIRIDGQNDPQVTDDDVDRAYRVEWTSAEITHWVDRGQHRILRTSAVTAKGGSLKTSYSIARVNQAVPADLFEHTPAGAKKVNQIK